ncbi:hypothetical protein J2W35_004938 [Variovorax boronicumulans]|nr:hypothetical protein [Variovorax boronicumulans]
MNDCRHIGARCEYCHEPLPKYALEWDGSQLLQIVQESRDLYRFYEQSAKAPGVHFLVVNGIRVGDHA